MPPTPNVRGQRQHQLAALEEGVRWNAPLSLRYGALTRPSQRAASRRSQGQSSPLPPTPGANEANSASRRKQRNSRGSRDTRTPQVAHRKVRRASVQLFTRPSLARSLGRAQHREKLDPCLGYNDARLTAFPALRLHSIPQRRTRPETTNTVATGYCSIPLRSTTEKPVRLANTLASASPVLAPETLADSLASTAAWSCAGPQSLPHLWPSVLRARPYGSPFPPESHGPPLRTTGQK